MKTVGDLLKAGRLEKKLSLEQISTYTKINKKYLEAIEQNEFQLLPPAAFTKGFLHTYAMVVGLDAQTVLAIFRRDYDQDDRGRIIPRSLVDSVKPISQRLTPTTLTFGFSLLAGILIIGFFIRQIIQFSASPPLSISEPVENAILISPITIRGTTDDQAIVSINNRPVATNQHGEFSTQIQLTPGQHTLVIVVSGRSGKKTTFERIITIEPSPVPNNP